MQDTITIGEMIKQLELLPSDKTIQYDFCYFAPNGEFDSYRGYYKDAYIGYSKDESCTCGELLQVLKYNLGTTMYGYKGGEYPVTEETLLWVSEYGRASGTRIKGITDHGWIAIIDTFFEE